MENARGEIQRRKPKQNARGDSRAFSKPSSLRGGRGVRTRGGNVVRRAGSFHCDGAFVSTTTTTDYYDYYYY